MKIRKDVNKNISIVTWIGGGNYGTTLQAFSLFYFLNKKGYNTSYLCPFPEKFGIIDHLKYVLDAIGLLYKIQRYRNRSSVRKIKIYDFIHENIYIKKIFNEKQYQKLLKETDCFITGSDQIWNTYYNYNPFYFLGFAKTRNRIAYASSIGTSNIPDQYSEIVKSHLIKFKNIGVREETAVNVLRELTGRNDIQQVIDPTLLLDFSSWNEMCRDAIVEFEVPSKYIFCYLVGNNMSYVEQLNDVRDKTGIRNIVVVPSAESPVININDAIIYNNAGPKEFVYLIKEATIVCTDSFHASAISLNFQKNFVEFLRFSDSDEVSQNSRIYDFLHHYNLSDRLYSIDYEWLNPIKYEFILPILQKDRENSEKYLIGAIEN